MRRAARTDANHAAIVRALRKAGVKVVDLSAVGKGVPDLLAGWGGRWTLLEVKDGAKPACERKLTPAQVIFHREHVGLPIFIVESEEAAIAAARNPGVWEG